MRNSSPRSLEGDAVAAEQENTPDQSYPERYYSEYLRLAADRDSMSATLHEVYNERKAWGWKLISATKEPDDDRLLMEWDTSGSFSE
jgi:hypothetical protein